MENNEQNDYNKEKIDKELLLFDKGLNEFGINEIEENSNIGSNKVKKKNIDWYTLYLILFKNTLSSKNLVPKEELKLRLNIIRRYLPPYYNCQKINIEDSNSNSIMKKLTYHLFPKTNLMEKLILKRKNNSFFGFGNEKEREKDKDKENDLKINKRSLEKRRSRTRIENHNPNFDKLLQINSKKNKDISELKIVEEFGTKDTSQYKRKEIKKTSAKINEDKYKDKNKLLFTPKKDEPPPPKNDYLKKFEKNVKIKFDRENNELYNIGNNNKDIIIRTQNDNEYPLILSEKRIVNNNNQTYFFDILNKLNEETKNEKINTYKKEVTSQVLKFNELYYDSKIDDFSQDNLFNEIKNTCDLFINKFNIDNQEEKNLADLDKFL